MKQELTFIKMKKILFILFSFVMLSSYSQTIKIQNLPTATDGTSAWVIINNPSGHTSGFTTYKISYDNFVSEIVSQLEIDTSLITSLSVTDLQAISGNNIDVNGSVTIQDTTFINYLLAQGSGTAVAADSMLFKDSDGKMYFDLVSNFLGGLSESEILTLVSDSAAPFYITNTDLIDSLNSTKWSNTTYGTYTGSMSFFPLDSGVAYISSTYGVLNDGTTMIKWLLSGGTTDLSSVIDTIYKYEQDSGLIRNSYVDSVMFSNKIYDGQLAFWEFGDIYYNGFGPRPDSFLQIREKLYIESENTYDNSVHTINYYPTVNNGDTIFYDLYLEKVSDGVGSTDDWQIGVKRVEDGDYSHVIGELSPYDLVDDANNSGYFVPTQTQDSVYVWFQTTGSKEAIITLNELSLKKGSDGGDVRDTVIEVLNDSGYIKCGLSVDAWKDSDLTTTNFAVTLYAASNNESTSFEWTGPSSFSESGSSATCFVGGIYTVVGTQGECTDTASIFVNTFSFDEGLTESQILQLVTDSASDYYITNAALIDSLNTTNWSNTTYGYYTGSMAFFPVDSGISYIDSSYTVFNNGTEMVKTLLSGGGGVSGDSSWAITEIRLAKIDTIRALNGDYIAVDEDIVTDSTMTATQFIASVFGTATTPSFPLDEDGNSGWYAASNDNLYLTVGGTNYMRFSGGILRSGISNSGYCQIKFGTPATRTNPTIVPNGTNGGTGVSSYLGDELNFVVNSVEALRISADRIGLMSAVKTTTGDPSSPQSGDITINESDNAIKIYADGAWRTLVTW